MDNNKRQIFPFLELPYYIRHDIYILALDYPDLDPIFERIQTQSLAHEEEHQRAFLPLCILPTPHTPVQLKTPGIMLCSRQTAWEARHAMHSKTFTLKRPTPYTRTLARPMDITEFISEDTLKGIRRVHFIIDFDCPSSWFRTMEVLLDVWSVETHLRRIEITVKQPHQMPSDQFWNQDSAYDAFRALSLVQNFARGAGIQLSGTPLPGPRILKAPWN